jgi:hypothetical protein
VRNTKETRWQTKVKGTKKAEPVVAKMAVSPAAVNPAAADKTVVKATTDPLDQASIPHPRLGFFGVIDERLDIELLDAVATSRPECISS